MAHVLARTPVRNCMPAPDPGPYANALTRVVARHTRPGTAYPSRHGIPIPARHTRPGTAYPSQHGIPVLARRTRPGTAPTAHVESQC
eukprot:366431-Chlamydomonas_euryale.AAC.10